MSIAPAGMQMIGLFNKGKYDNKKSDAQQVPVLQKKPQPAIVADKKPVTQQEAAGFFDFQKRVYDVKEEVILAIDNMDKQGAIDKLILLSNLSATAIYNHNLREIVVVDEAISEIKKTIDTKLASLKKTTKEKISPEAEYYTLIRLSMIPVCSMLNVLDTHTSTAISQANDEIDGKIQELQRFLVEYETQLAKGEPKKSKK